MKIEEALYDGFLRVSLERVLESKFVHLMSDLILETQEQRDFSGAVWASGYSEWCSLDKRPISIGWDWSVVVGGDRRLRVKRVGVLRSNVMLINSRGLDFGWHESLAALGSVVDVLPWKAPVWHRLEPLSPV